MTKRLKNTVVDSMPFRMAAIVEKAKQYIFEKIKLFIF